MKFLWKGEHWRPWCLLAMESLALPSIWEWGKGVGRILTSHSLTSEWCCANCPSAREIQCLLGWRQARRLTTSTLLSFISLFCFSFSFLWVEGVKANNKPFQSFPLLFSCLAASSAEASPSPGDDSVHWLKPWMGPKGVHHFNNS